MTYRTITFYIWIVVLAGCSSGAVHNICDGGICPATDGGSGNCSSVDDCMNGLSCINGNCQDPSRFQCRNNLTPTVQLEPSLLDFGAVTVGHQTIRTLKIRNIGACNLTLMSASIDPTTTTEFSCPTCTPMGRWPVTLAPFDQRLLMVHYNATDAEPDTGYLSVISDDPQFSHVRVKLQSTVKDFPRIMMDKNILDFGYVEVGYSKTLSFTVTNVGGETPLQITSMNLSTSPDVHYEYDAGTLPLYVNYNTAGKTFDVTYHPQSMGTHESELMIKNSDPTLQPDNNGDRWVSVSLKGYSEQPPKITVTPLNINFGQVTLGYTAQRQGTITNTGEAALNATLSFAPLSSTDFNFSPTAIASMAAGANSYLYFEFTPTQLGPAQALVYINHNASNESSPIQVELVAEGIPTTGADVLAIEMTYENGSDSEIDDDLRNVDLHYKSAYFHDCSKEYTDPPRHQRTCNWGVLGNPTWTGIGLNEEPERIIHTDAPEDSSGDGTYAVELYYVEDCKSLPVQLIASVAGIAVELVIQYLTEGLAPGGVGSLLAEIIANTCFSRGSSDVQLKIYINGQQVGERQVRVQDAGDYLTDVVRIKRQNGIFTLLP